MVFFSASISPAADGIRPTPSGRAATIAAQKPQEHPHYIINNSARFSVYVEFPSINVPAIDTQLKDWASQQVAMFLEGMKNIPQSDPSHFVLRTTYDVFFPSSNSTSVVFFVLTYTGNETPELGVVTLTFDAKTGKQLGFRDIFSNAGELFTFFSEYCRIALQSRNWTNPEHLNITNGTLPLEINFSLFSLSKSGIVLYFPPNQVASAYEGIVEVEIPLELLKPFKPDYRLWNIHPSVAKKSRK